MKSRISAESLVAFALLAAAVFCRLALPFAGGVPNFSPLAAIALCGGIYFPRRLAFVVPLAALFVSDLVLNAHYGVALVSTEMLSRYVALALITALGCALGNRAHLFTVLSASLCGSVGFYIATNTASWLGSAAYAKTFAGWAQALTTGLPGYPPTWVFFRNTLAGDLVFTALFFACMALPLGFSRSTSSRSVRAALP